MFKFFSAIISAGLFFLTLILIAVSIFLGQVSADLPDYKQLERYEPPVTTRLFAGDGQLLMEYAAEKRLFVPINKIPNRVKNVYLPPQ